MSDDPRRISMGEFTADGYRRLAAAVAHWLTTVPDGVASSADRRAYRDLRDDLLEKIGTDIGTNERGEDGRPAIIEPMSITELAAIRGCRPEYLTRLCRQGRLPAVRIGRTWVIDRTAAP